MGDKVSKSKAGSDETMSTTSTTTTTTTTVSPTTTTSGSPVSTSFNHEATALDMSVADAWTMIRKCDFAFLTSLDKADEYKNPDVVGGERTLHYTDSTTQKIRITEISDVQHQIQFTLVDSNPSISYHSRDDRIKVTNLSFGSDGKTTTDVKNPRILVEWHTDFSNDADGRVIQDCKYKKHEAFAALYAARKQ